MQNRSEATAGRFGLDSTGPEWEDGDTLWASVDFVRGMRTMREGAIDVYGIVMVRCRYTDEINERSRIVYNGKTYQILGETLHVDKQDNIVQFNAQQLVNTSNDDASGGEDDIEDAIAGAVAGGYRYMGVITPTATPDTMMANIFYIAKKPGTYTYINGYVLRSGVVLFKWDGMQWFTEKI